MNARLPVWWPLLPGAEMVVAKQSWSATSCSGLARWSPTVLRPGSRDETQGRQDGPVRSIAQAARSEHFRVVTLAPPVRGNRDGDVTMVEFFDYRCPYCKVMAPRVAPLIGRDAGLRLVMKECPVLGRETIFSAKVALVAARPGL